MLQEQYLWVYLIASVFGTYTLYRFMGIFFKHNNTYREILSYCAFHILINGIYIHFSIPILTVAANLIALFCLTLNYQATFKQRTVAVALIYTMLAVIELGGAVVLGGSNFNFFSVNTDFQSSQAIILIKLATFCAVLILENYQNMKRGLELSHRYWVATILIPIGSLFVQYSLLQVITPKAILIYISIFLIFLINLLVFYLYDGLNENYGHQTRTALLAQQNQYYHHQLQMMNDNYQMVQKTRHDLKNHYIALGAFIQQGDYKEGLDYLEQLIQSVDCPQEFVSSGNHVVDSLVNYKLYQAVDQGATVSAQVNVSDQIAITPFEMTVILGNILDNAINAISKVENPKTINLKMTMDHSRLYIKLGNHYNGDIRSCGKRLLTTHPDSSNHGIGLKHVQEIVDRYPHYFVVQQWM